MEVKSVFISSCSRREFARRRSAHSLMRVQLMVAMLILVLAAGAFVAARGGV